APTGSAEAASSTGGILRFAGGPDGSTAFGLAGGAGGSAAFGFAVAGRPTWKTFWHFGHRSCRPSIVSGMSARAWHPGQRIRRGMESSSLVEANAYEPEHRGW